MLEEIIKREANILLASLDKDNIELNLPYMNFLVDFGKLLDKHNFTELQLENLYKYINKFRNSGLLAPLTLRSDEFDENGNNIRYPYINIKNKIMYNNNAFNCYVRASYQHTIKCENEIQPFIIKQNSRVYISKGGVITGEYFDKCAIRKNIINSGSFTIQSVINIPVYEILDHDISIRAVDHREPKFKALCEFYNVPIRTDVNIKKRGYNIRKYTKLKNLL